MTLRHFQIFVAVCDTMNMTAAATELYVTQSAVSQAIADLERHYQVRLFERLSKKLYLTKGGERLVGYARHIIRMNLDAEHEMRNLSQSGLVRIGASVTIASSLLPELALSMQHALPTALLEIREENTQNIEQLILCDQLDIGLVEGEILSPDILSEPFAKDDLILICGRGHHLAGRDSVTAHELAQENFILREQGSGTRKTFEDTMARHHLCWSSSWTCNNTDSIKEAVSLGLGISTLSERTVHRQLSEGTLLRIPVPELSFRRQFKIVYHKNKYITQAMQQVVRFCFASNSDFSPPALDNPSNFARFPTKGL